MPLRGTRRPAMAEMVTSELRDGDAPSDEVPARVRDAAQYPVAFDEYCPALTDEDLREFRPVNPGLHRNPESFRLRKADTPED